MLLSVWVLFIVTWSPYLILNCILSYWLSLGLDVDGKEGTILIQTFGLLTMANSSMNPLLYAFLSKLVDYMSTLYTSPSVHVLKITWCFHVLGNFVEDLYAHLLVFRAWHVESKLRPRQFTPDLPTSTLPLERKPCQP